MSTRQAPLTDPAIAPGLIDPATASADIDLAAFGRNIQAVARLVAPAEVMVVVKAEGYGHGMLRCAQAARAVGVSWLGVATPGEALALRASGDTGRILCWLYGPTQDFTALVATEVDITVSSETGLGGVLRAVADTGRRARVQLKFDTGLARNGSSPTMWAELCRAAAAAVRDGAIELTGLWSHLATADEPGHPAIDQQSTAFDVACLEAERAELPPTLRHFANSAAALSLPRTHFDLVRLGIAAYGIDPGACDGAGPNLAQAAGVTLEPVMTLRAQLVAARDLPAGAGVSYGHTWIAERPTRVGLVPLGYGDGIPRHAGSTAAVGWSADTQRPWAPIRGRVCMDQFVVEAPGAEVGDEVVLFGDPGAPTATDWARWCGTIGYEIVTRIGPRVPRRYFGDPILEAHAN